MHSRDRKSIVERVDRERERERERERKHSVPLIMHEHSIIRVYSVHAMSKVA